MTKQKNICPSCGGFKKSGNTTFTTDLGFGVVVIRNVPATICGQCGADWISDATAKEIEKIVNETKEKKTHNNISLVEWNHIRK